MPAEITLRINGKTFIKPEGITGRELLAELAAQRPVAALRVNNEICPLSRAIDINADIEPVFADTAEGASVYRRTLCFVLAAAARSLFAGRHLLVGHSLGYGYYYTLGEGGALSQRDLDVLKGQMDALIRKDLPIDNRFLAYRDAVRLFEEEGLSQSRLQMEYICPPKIQINTMEGFCDMYFGPLLPRTGMLTTFGIMAYQDGFLLRFPVHDEPGRLPEFTDMPKLFAVYRSYKQWGRRLGVTSAASLNKLIHDRAEKDFINITETLQNKRIADIADAIHQRPSVRVVLIAGPSSSGKTTTSLKLALQLRALGYRPKVISLDNYYVGRELNPRDENGNYDYECLEALDIALLNQNLVDLFDGRTVEVPSYDFDSGSRYYSGRTMRLEENDILIMEGIHGLNDRLTPRIPAEKKFKIYLSALTQLNLDDHNRISTSDNRLVRRIVRDSNFRGKSAAATISMWANVQKGERLHIFPFQNNADAMLNTALDYELPVLKVYAEPLLRCVSPLQPEYAEASRLLRFINNFLPIPATSVPGQSIIREFIGGSDFRY